MKIRKSQRHLLFIAIWLIAVVTANGIITIFGPKASIVTAFVFIGLTLTTRDILHEYWRNDIALKMGILIMSGGSLSYLMQIGSGRIAIASVVAFAVSEAFDALVYHKLIKRSPLIKINGSNLGSAALDSMIFPYLAFGVWMWPIVLGHFAAKVIGGFLWSLVIRKHVERIQQ